MIHGRTALRRDLNDLLAERDQGVFKAEDVALPGLGGERPHVTFAKAGAEHRLDCDFIAGCYGRARLAMAGSEAPAAETAEG